MYCTRNLHTVSQPALFTCILKAGGPAAVASTSSPRGAAAPVQGAAAAAQDGDDSSSTLHEKSFDSEMADEGLDMSHMSQTREVSLFAGPYLNYSEEETVLGMSPYGMSFRNSENRISSVQNHISSLQNHISSLQNCLSSLQNHIFSLQNCQ